MSNKLKLYSMLQDGFAAKQEARKKDKEANPGGDWRGGNSGCLTEDGIFLGASPMDAVLRNLGIEIPTTLDDDLIFEAGFKNEVHWEELLNWANIEFRQEEECPIVWSLPNGETITGRPDIVVGEYPGVYDGKFIPTFGIELKLISSNGKMVRHSHFGNANPTPGHVCQSAHYSHQMGRDWVLAYTSRAHYTAFYFGEKQWQFEHRSMLMDPKGTGKVINVSPFISMYDLTWDGDTLLLDGKPTLITASGIERFYQYCSDCVANRIIPVNGGTVDIWGKAEKRNTNVLYSDWSAADAGAEFDQWVAECREIAETT